MVVIFQYYIYEGLLKIASNIVGSRLDGKEEGKKDIRATSRVRRVALQVFNNFLTSFVCPVKHKRDKTQRRKRKKRERESNTFQAEALAVVCSRLYIIHCAVGCCVSCCYYIFSERILL
jgi:hypothetical protein